MRGTLYLSLVAVVAAAAFTGPLAAGPQNETWAGGIEKANGLYEAGEYAEAIAVYEEVVKGGAVNADLYYNLGNAYYKDGQLGRAVLYYEKALRLAPRDGDVRTNLGLVKSLLRDKQLLQQPGLVKRIFAWPHHNMNVQESTVISSTLYLLLTLVLVGFIFRETGFVSKAYSRLSMASPGRFLGLDKREDFFLAMVSLLVLVSVSTTSAIQKYKTATERAESIVVEEEVAVYGRPSEDSTLQFKIHEGTKVTTVERRPGWVQIRLQGDLFGWVDDESVERI